MKIDFTSSQWKAIVEWAGEELKKARERNDDAALPDAETNAVRGEIRFIKRLLSLPAKTATMAGYQAPGEDPALGEE